MNKNGLIKTVVFGVTERQKAGRPRRELLGDVKERRNMHVYTVLLDQRRRENCGQPL